MNSHINPVLYNFYLALRTNLGARMVHRRRRKSSDCIEIIFTSDALKSLTGHLNTRKEAEECGFWIMCRRQTKRGHASWLGHAVFQLFLTPVHPKKQHKSQAEEVTFEPITISHNRHKKLPLFLHMSKKYRTFAPQIIDAHEPHSFDYWISVARAGRRNY